MQCPSLRTKLTIAICATLLTSTAYSETCQSDNPNTIDGILQVRLIDNPERDTREDIRWKTLELALEKSRVPYDLDVSSFGTAPDRQIKQMRELGVEGNVYWSVTDREWEKASLPVRVPLSRGLNSYFNIWVAKKDVEKFSDIKTLDALTQFSVLQGTNWSTIPGLEAAGFDVRQGAFLNLVKMLAANRADALLYSAIQSARIEGLGSEELGLVPLPDLLIRFPLDDFFYVDACSKDLHDAIFNGLMAAFEDGSYDTMMNTYPGVIEGYEVILSDAVKVLDVNNTELTEESARVMDEYKLDAILDR